MAADTQTAPSGKSSSETDTRAQPGRKGTGKAENVFTRKIGPLPMWVWVAIVGAAVVLYALWKGHSSSSTPASSGASGTKTGSALVPPEVAHGQEGQDDEDDEDRKKHRRRKHGGKGGGKKEGPEREWLEKKTGSEHPWTFLRKHHEKIEVGPKGSKTIRGKNDRIVHGKDPRKHAHRRDHEEATENTATPTRALPGAAGGPNSGPAGTLVSFTVPQSGTVPSLAQVASQYNTAPDAIVEEATGRGSPHGAEWRRYVANHDWQVPLPHGTDMTILSQPN